MKPAYAVSLAAALFFHALLLFGFNLDTAALPLAISDEPSPVDVSLVAVAPESPPAEPAASPEPAPTPEPPMPEPTPEMSTPPPAPEPTPSQETAPAPQPSRETPVPRPHEQKHSRKTGPATAPATTQGGAHQGAATTGPIGTSARYRSNPRPEYPEEARRLHQEGVVLLSVEVSEDGRATDVSLKRSSGSDLLDQAALQAVKRWTFEPARVASLPVSSRVDVPIRFSLSE